MEMEKEFGGNCPFIHLCDKEQCRKESVCLNPQYWSHYWRKKSRQKEAELGITKQERRKLEKQVKKKLGRRKFKRQQKEAARLDAYANTPHCVQSGDYCDKHESCRILGQCIATLERFQNKPEIMDALRVPRRLTEIIRLLAKHDPEPMKSWYRK